jgi:SAM-dependent methyltransferase
VTTSHFIQVGPTLASFRHTCRACGYGDLVDVLDLGSQPLANGFRRPDDVTLETRFPLKLVRCPACELVQLTVIVAPEIMYGSHYPYLSGQSNAWAAHCHALAKEIGSGKKILEIGCLDGVMLRHCRDKGCDVTGIDPSSPVVDLPIYREFFTRYFKLPGETFDVIVAQNVFGHVDDAKGFLEGVASNLTPDGTAIIECPWVVDLVDGVRWDTVYHEHLSYWGLRPLYRLAVSLGLVVYKVRAFPEIHGGTMRYYLRHCLDRYGPDCPRIDPSIDAIWADEEMDSTDWKRFRFRVSQQVDHWEKWFALADPGSVAAYGASAKLNVFLNALSTRPPLVAVFDDTPSKIGLLTPGWHIPIKAPSREAFEGLDTLLVGSPNWITELEHNARSWGFTGEVKSLW